MYDSNKYEVKTLIDKYDDVPEYEAVFLFDFQSKNKCSKDCIFSPIHYDEKNGQIWKNMLNKRAFYDFEEYYLMIPHSDSTMSPQISGPISNKGKVLTTAEIYNCIISPMRLKYQSEFTLPLDISNFKCFDLTGEMINKIIRQYDESN